MRMVIIASALTLIGFYVHAQAENPVHWHFKSERIKENVYELHFDATIEMPWHIYSQDNSEDITQPTSFEFKKSPLIEVIGKIKEAGDLDTEHISGATLKYYENHVEFIQIVKVKAAVKTNVSGIINYMACTNGRCLPPVEQSFSISLQYKPPKL